MGVVGTQGGLAALHYKRQIGTYYTLADCASTAADKLRYLKLFQAKVADIPDDRYGAVWLWKRPDTNVGENKRVLATLVSRLEAIAPLSESSLEYQQGMLQITQHEFVQFDFETAYVIQEAGSAAILWPLWLLAGGCALVAGAMVVIAIAFC